MRSGCRQISTLQTGTGPREPRQSEMQRNERGPPRKEGKEKGEKTGTEALKARSGKTRRKGTQSGGSRSVQRGAVGLWAGRGLSEGGGGRGSCGRGPGRAVTRAWGISRERRRCRHRTQAAGSRSQAAARRPGLRGQGRPVSCLDSSALR